MRYFGYGPAECYEDKCSHALLGYHNYTPDDPADAHDYLQECGSHCRTELLSPKSGDVSLCVTGKFSFSASRYTLHDVTEAMHMKDLKKTDGTFLYIDYCMSGVGSASCDGQNLD